MPRSPQWTLALASSVCLLSSPPLAGQLSDGEPELPSLRRSATHFGALPTVGGGVREIELPGGLQDPQLARLAEGWLLSATRPGADGLFLAVLDPDGGVRHLPSPHPSQAPIRRDPVPLLERGELVGLAWLEGESDRSLGVRSASWNATAWGPGVVVSPPGAGSQLALAGTVLADRSWMLVWSCVVEGDDDILFSRRGDESWSAPKPVHRDNEVPDITPAVIALEDAARLAWSRYDGAHYRLHLADFRNGRWQEVATPSTLGAGVVLPTFPPAGRGRLVLYRTAVPYGWTLLQLDGEAGVRYRAHLPYRSPADRQRPVVRTSAEGPLFTWPARGGRAQARWEAVP